MFIDVDNYYRSFPIPDQAPERVLFCISQTDLHLTLVFGVFLIETELPLKTKLEAVENGANMFMICCQGHMFSDLKIPGLSARPLISPCQNLLVAIEMNPSYGKPQPDLLAEYTDRFWRQVA